MDKQKQILRQILMGIVMLLLLAFPTQLVNAQENTDGAKEISVILSVERFAIGKGWIIEPMEIKATDRSVVSEVIEDYLKSQGYTCESNNSTYGYYLQGIDGADPQDTAVTVPQSTLDMAEEDGEPINSSELKNKYAPDLLEFSYTSTAGWMYSVNNIFPSYGMGNYYLKDGEVIRIQFTLYGLGADVSGTGYDSSYNQVHYYNCADKSDLYRKMAKINDSKNTWLITQDDKDAYQKACEVSMKLDATQVEVDRALDALPENEASDAKAFKESIVQLTQAKAIAYNAIQVSWKAVAGAESYTLYRKTDSTDYKKLTTINQLTYTDTSVTTGTKYTYTVKANKTFNGAAIQSTANQAGIYAKTSLGTAGLKKAAKASYNKITVTWNKVAGASGYFIYRKSGTSGWKKVGTVAKNSVFTYTDTGLNTGTKYTYTVKAYRSVSTGDVYGNYNTTGVSATPTLDTPVLGKAVSADYNKVKITWKKVSGASGYYVYRKNGSSWELVTTIKSGATLSYTHSGLTTGTKYTYTVKAYRTVNKKPISSSYNTKGISAVPTLGTVKLGKVASVNTGLKITWSKVSGASGYYVYRKNGSSWKKIGTVTKNSTVSFIDKTAKKGSKYTYTVRAYRMINKMKKMGGYNQTGISGKRSK